MELLLDACKVLWTIHPRSKSEEMLDSVNFLIRFSFI
jgi:hypothetical protein